MQGIIIDLNERKKNIKMHTTYEYKSDKNTSTSTNTGLHSVMADPVTGDADKKDGK